MSYTYINDDQIDIELRCTICDEPFQSPVNCTNCGNTFCQVCIIKWMQRQLSCPSCRQMGNNFLPVISRVILNQLNRLLVQCSLCQERNIQRTNFNDHISLICPKQVITCNNQCRWIGLRENLQQHIIECPKQRIICSNTCGWNDLREYLQQHIIECPKQAIACIDNCGWTGLRENLQQHLIECSKKPLLGISISTWWMPIVCLILAFLFYFILRAGENKKTRF